MEIEKPFKCSTCSSQFTNVAHLQVHVKRHEMSLNLSKPGGGLSLASSNVPDGYIDETPTPTRLFLNCEEVGLFQDLQNQSLINPFDLQFTKAASSATPSSEDYEFNFSIANSNKKIRVDDTLNTPQVFGYPGPTSASTPLSIPSSSSTSTTIPSDITTNNIVITTSSTCTTTTSSSTSSSTCTAVSTIIQNSGVSTTSSSSAKTDNHLDIIEQNRQTSSCSNFERITCTTTDDSRVESTTPDNDSFNIPPLFSNNDSINSSHEQVESKLRLNSTPLAIESLGSGSHLLYDPISSSTGTIRPQSEGNKEKNHQDGIQSIQYFDEVEEVTILETKKVKKPTNCKKTELLERNRAAASRSRERRKQWVTGLETRIQSLQSLLSNATHKVNGKSVTQNEVLKLRQENRFLKEELVNHANCDITKAGPCQTISILDGTKIQVLKHSVSSTSSSSATSTDRSGTSTGVITVSSFTNDDKSAVINPAVPILPPFPRNVLQTKAKRGRPRKGCEKRVSEIIIPTQVNSIPCSISVPKSPVPLRHCRNILPPNANLPKIVSTTSTGITPIKINKIEVVPVKVVDHQQISNIFLLKPQKN